MDWNNHMFISATKKLPPSRWPTLDSSEQVIPHFLISQAPIDRGSQTSHLFLRKVRSLHWPLFQYETFINLTLMTFEARLRWVQIAILQTLSQTVLFELGEAQPCTKLCPVFLTLQSLKCIKSELHNSHRKHDGSSRKTNLVYIKL